MNKINNGGSAFPMIRDMRHNPDWDYHEGMSLRDYFAAKAMQGMLASPHANPKASMMRCAMESYAMADAMLAMRQK